MGTGRRFYSTRKVQFDKKITKANLLLSGEWSCKLECGHSVTVAGKYKPKTAHCDKCASKEKQ